MTGPDAARDEPVRAWAASGAMALTGPPEGPGLGPPAPLVPRLRTVADLLRRHAGTIGVPVEVDPLALLTERAAIRGLRRRGRTSCGGAAQLLRAADGWIAVSLARSEDRELLPAWLDLPAAPVDAWATVRAEVGTRTTLELEEQAVLLGLPVGVLPHAAAPPPSDGGLGRLPVRAERLGPADRAADASDLVVVDLSSLWAGPLCGALLVEAGMDVVKVESTSRPDGARRGPPTFFDQVNAGKAMVALDFATTAGRAALRQLLAGADVVIEGSRPRVLEQMGIDARAVLRAGRPRVWLSITGHGRTGTAAHRIGFGDDAAVAGGLVAWSGAEPSFCADAVADPSTGLVAAAAILSALVQGGRWLIDASLAGVAAHLAGPTLPVPADVDAAAPQPRPPRGAARPLGADTDAVLSLR